MTLKKKHFYKKRGPDICQKSTYATFYMKLWQYFCILTAGYKKSYHSEKSLKGVISTPVTKIWRLLTRENWQMICKPYDWDKQHQNISPLTHIADWLMAMRCSHKTSFHFLSVSNVHISILWAQNHFCGIFLESHKYLQHIFSRRIRDVTE